MTSIDEKFVRQVVPYLDSVDKFQANGNAAYRFVCPLCSDYSQPDWNENKKARMKRKKTAALLPIKDCNYKYVFSCRKVWCKSLSLYHFLEEYNPPLASRYKHEKELLSEARGATDWCEVEGMRFDFTPKWDKRKINSQEES